MRTAGPVSFAILTAMFLTFASPITAQAGAPIKDMVATYPSMVDSLYGRFNATSPQTKLPTSGYEAAPMPNQDASAPRIAQSQGPEVAPSLLGAKSTGFRGDGFVPGSTPQVQQAPKKMSLPGISLKVPLY
jgi:hypothetical protein